MKHTLPIEIGFDPTRLKRFVMICCGVILIGLSTYIFPDFWGKNNQLKLTVAAGVCCITLFFFLKRLYTKPVAMVIDEFGITDLSSWGAFGFLPWADIDSIFVKIIRKNEFVMVKLKDEHGVFHSETKAWKKPFMKFNALIYGAPYCFSLLLLDVDPNELMFIIRTQIEKAREKGYVVAKGY